MAISISRRGVKRRYLAADLGCGGGKPIAIMLLQKQEYANATVTVIHTRTKDMAFHCKRADILIVAAGVQGLVKPDWIKPGSCVIDVGINRVGTKISKKTGREVAILKGDDIRSGKGWYTGSERRHHWKWLETNFPEAAAGYRIS